MPIYVFHGFKLLSNWANDVFIIGVIVSFIYYYLFLQGGKKTKNMPSPPQVAPPE